MSKFTERLAQVLASAHSSSMSMGERLYQIYPNLMSGCKLNALSTRSKAVEAKLISNYITRFNVQWCGTWTLSSAIFWDLPLSSLLLCLKVHLSGIHMVTHGLWFASFFLSFFLSLNIFFFSISNTDLMICIFFQGAAAKAQQLGAYSSGHLGQAPMWTSCVILS